MATETLPDPPALRQGRRRRLLDAMAAAELDLLVLGRVANIRYASGVPILWNAGTRPFGPGCLVVRDSEEVYLLSTWDEGVPDDIPHDHLFGITWNPMNYVQLLKDVAARAKPGRVGTDAYSPLFANLFPMAFGDTPIVDATDAIRSARRTKTPEELEAIRGAVGVAEVAMAAAVAELQPGARVPDVAARFMEAMAAAGVTTPANQDVVRVTSPTADPSTLAAGDLVTIDAGVVADGYAGEVGRTFAVPGAGSEDGPADDRTALLDRAARLRDALVDACRPGAPATSLLDAYAAAGEALPVRPVARGLGLGFDDPVVTGDLPDTAARERLDPGVALVLTARVHDPARGSAVIQEPVVVTDDGPELLARTAHRPTGATL